jgi:hypothetical protein
MVQSSPSVYGPISKLFPVQRASGDGPSRQSRVSSVTASQVSKAVQSRRRKFYKSPSARRRLRLVRPSLLGENRRSQTKKERDHEQSRVLVAQRFVDCCFGRCVHKHDQRHPATSCRHWRHWTRGVRSHVLASRILVSLGNAPDFRRRAPPSIGQRTHAFVRCIGVRRWIRELRCAAQG